MLYLLDSNICIYLLRGNENVIEHIEKVGWENCCISEYSLAELYYGAMCSDRPSQNKDEVKSLCEDLQIIPISDVLLEFAEQKAYLRRHGNMIEDADIFIGSTAIVNNMVMVTENIKHLNRLQGIVVENWCM